MKQLDLVATVLVVVGALNWGLVGLANFDLVAALFGMRFGETSALTASSTGWSGWRASTRRWRSRACRSAGRTRWRRASR